MEQYLTPDEVATKLNVSVTTVLRQCRAGYLRSFVVPGGRARRIPESAVTEWLNQVPPEDDDGGSVVSIEGRR